MRILSKISVISFDKYRDDIKHYKQELAEAHFVHLVPPSPRDFDIGYHQSINTDAANGSL